jgi:hypothetical protein
LLVLSSALGHAFTVGRIAQKHQLVSYPRCKLCTFFGPPTTEDTDECAGGWMQEMERLGYRNWFHPLIRAPEERLPPRGVWPHALARVATLPDVVFEVLRSKPSLVPSEDPEGKEAAKNTGVSKKRKHGDE